MRRENTENPICPRCESTLDKNGFVRSNHKTRFRCLNCGYSETLNSVAPNRNKRLTFELSNVISTNKPKDQLETVRRFASNGRV